MCWASMHVKLLLPWQYALVGCEKLSVPPWKCLRASFDEPDHFWYITLSLPRIRGTTGINLMDLQILYDFRCFAIVIRIWWYINLLFDIPSLVWERAGGLVQEAFRIESCSKCMRPTIQHHVARTLNIFLSIFCSSASNWRWRRPVSSIAFETVSFDLDGSGPTGLKPLTFLLDQLPRLSQVKGFGTVGWERLMSDLD